MWTDRNETLHGEGNTIHLEEIKAINAELLHQMDARSVRLTLSKIPTLISRQV